MKNVFQRMRFTFVFFIFVSVFLNFQLQASASSIVEEVRQYVRNYYVDRVDENILNAPTPEGIVSQLDPYSSYMTKRQYEEFLNSIEGQYVGIGVAVEAHTLGVQVTSVFKDGPAQRAGLQPGDVIIEVDGRSLRGITLEQSLTIIKGEEGTTVKLKVFRPSVHQYISFHITRETIKFPTVEFERLAGNIGYIRLYSFDTECVTEVQRAIRALSGVKGWIFDLRDNSGGYVVAAQHILGFFPNTKVAFHLRDGRGNSETYNVIPQSIKMNGDIHILVNSFSASASEMVAAALKDGRAVKIYGQKTFGKGSMQQMFQLSDGSVLKLTIARFFSPTGKTIHEVGVTPHVVTAVNKELYAAHRAFMMKQLSQYDNLGKMHHVPSNKVFKVKFSRKLLNTKSNQLSVKLYEIGGKEVQIVPSIKSNELTIQSVQPLKKGGNYLLVIPPTVQSKDQAKMKKGAFIEVSVDR
ncbi:C-terminal peptidase prc [Anoxybacillus kamchatkensis]|uniref:S41 family peptidase n=1 Tax=Anoxybacillus ayderensis TaxID=265546 RepID=UPI0015EC8219|nr:S41 family peptidase [Anoxybacillus ayderensis]MBA2877216.1 C-terminal peptidase prc [Anoxybacillus ayderensis]